MNGTIFQIEQFSVYDGPGIRTSVFLKGCPLRCSWCHNPEGQRREPETVKNPNGCIGCGMCETYAVLQNDKKVYTENSINHCPKKLLRTSGTVYTPEELFETVMKNAMFLNGVTFSGGEPLMQHEFLTEALALFQGKLHTAVQTCGYAEKDVFRKVLAACDYVLFDLKIIDAAKSRAFTGVDPNPILENFAVLASGGHAFTVRVPLIPTVTDTVKNITAIATLLKRHGVRYAELLPYNKMAGGKYASVGRVYTPRFDTTVTPQPHPEIFNEYGIAVKIL